MTIIHPEPPSSAPAEQRQPLDPGTYPVPAHYCYQCGSRYCLDPARGVEPHPDQHTTALPKPLRQAIVQAALLASHDLDVPNHATEAHPAHAETLRQLAAYFQEWADSAERAITHR